MSGAVIIVGGGTVGCEIAEFLISKGVGDVTVVEMLKRIAATLTPTYRPFFLARLKKDGVKFEAETTVTRITGKGVDVMKNGTAGFLHGHTVVIAAGYKADPKKIEQFQGSAAEIYCVGDCVHARMIKDAIEEGFNIGKSI